MRLASFCASVTLLFGASLSVIGQELPKQDPAALALIEQARAKYTLVQPSTPSFVLEATLRIFDQKGKQSAVGVLEEDSVEGGPWKRTLGVGDRRSATYFSNGELLQDGPEPDSLYVSRAIEALFSPVPAADYFPEKIVLHQRPTKANSVELNCVVIEVPSADGKYFSPHDAFCFAGSPAILRRVDGYDSSQVGLNRILIFGERYVPGDVEVYSNGVLRASLHVDRLSRAPLLKGGDLTPPSSAVDVRPVRLDPAALGPRISGLQPVYPETAKQQHIQGTVALHAIIGKDGAVRTLAVISTPDESLTLSALAAVRTWQYKPYLRNGQPVEVETALCVNYSFSR